MADTAALLSFPRVSPESSQLMNSARERTLVTRFQRLIKDQNALDFDRALLARDIRNEFLPGEDGDFQFRLWLREKLDVRVKTAERLNLLARAVTLYPLKADWDLIGGSSTVVFLLGLTTQQRNRLFNALRRKANETGRPLTRATAVKVARDIGIAPRATGPGKARLQRDRLVEFVRNLNESGKLPNLPSDIRSLIN